MTKSQREWSLRGKIELIGKIVGFVVMILTLAALFTGGIEWYKSLQAPEFDFRYGGMQTNVPPIYEVTEWLADTDSKKNISIKSIIVSAEYSGKEHNGQVLIKIKPASGKSKEVTNWSNFRSNHSDLPLDLVPSRLSNYAGVNCYEYPGNRGQFEIEIAPPEDKPLHTEKITVVNTPWLHYTQLSDASIFAGEPITACVTVKNFGCPSEFCVYGILYDATDTNTSLLELAEWWPGVTWDSTNYSKQEVTNKIDTKKECTIVLTINGSFFKERHMYILETYAVKNLPYLKFHDGNWTTSFDRWRVRDQPHYSTIVVLAQNKN